MSGGHTGAFDFGPYRLDARRRTLSRDGQPLPLTPKAFDILRLLVEQHGRIVEKAEILETVWPHTNVEEGNLTVNISLIRRLLGESRKEHPFIVTVPGRGYQFVGDVRCVGEPRAEDTQVVASATDAAAEVQVAQVVDVAAAAFRWRAGLSLGRRVLVGSALILSLALPIVLPGSRPADERIRTADQEARALYLQGRFLLGKRTEDGLLKGERYFQRAIERAPEYASAYAGLADAYSMQSYFGMVPPGEAHRRARDAALKALALDPDSAEAHTSMAYILHRFEWNWSAADRSFRRAIALDPQYALARHWYGAFLDSMGRRQEAIAEGRRAEMLDPLTPVISANLNSILGPDSAADFFQRGQRMLEKDPEFWLSHWSIGHVYRATGRAGLAIEEYERAAELAGRGTYVLSRLGVAYAEEGRTADAHAILRELDMLSRRRYVSPFTRAPIYAALGDRDEAFAWLWRALEERSTQLAFIGVSLSPLRSDPRFEGLLTRVGLK